MTESEAISWLKTLKGMYRAYPSEVIKAWDVAIEALEEVQKYRAIGTVEECRGCMDILNKKEAVFELAKIAEEWILYHRIGTIEECREARERQKLKKVRYVNMLPVCTECDCELKRWYAFCPDCGQKLDWTK